MKEKQILNIIRIAGIVCILAVFYFGWKGCQEPDDGPTTDQRRVDSIRAVLEVERAGWDRSWKGYQQARQDQERKIAGLTEQLAATKGEALKSAKKAGYWAGQYDSAKAALDTAAQLAACDTIRYELDQYIAASQTALQAADSVIFAQATQIHSQGEMISLQEQQIAKERSATSFVLGENESLALENKKLKKKVKNTKWKMIGAAIAGFLLGTIK